jgi:hypothetical protein
MPVRVAQSLTLRPQRQISVAGTLHGIEAPRFRRVNFQGKNLVVTEGSRGPPVDAGRIKGFAGI